jgi:hypothetical protein
MPNGDTVAVVRPLGGVVDIPAAQLKAAQEQGYKLATPTEVRTTELEAEYGGVGQQALALGAGALGGVTFGASDYLISKTSEDAREALAAYREVHPGTVLTGEILGGIGGVALSGGTGLAARAISAPTRAVTAIARGAARGRQILGTGRAARLVGAGLEAGVEAGVEVLGHTVGEAAIQNQELTAEKMVAALGTGALYGGGLGAGFSFGGMLLGGARSRLAKALGKADPDAVEKIAEGAFGAAAPGVGRKVSDKLAKLSAAVSGKDEALIRRLGAFDAEGAKLRRLAATEGDDIVNRLTGDFEASINKTQEALEATRIGAGGALKREHVSRIIRRDNAAEQMLQAQETFRKARDVLEEMRADKAKFHQGGLKQLSERLGHFERELAAAAKKGDDVSSAAFTGLDSFKREWQQLTKQHRRSKKAVAMASHDLLRATDDQVFRPLLQSTDMWGEVGTFQKLINQAWTEGLSGPIQKFQREMMTRYGRVAGDPYQDAFIARREGIAGYLKNLDNPDKSLQHRAAREYLDFLDSYSDAATKTLDLSPTEAAQFTELKKQAAKLRSYTDEAAETVTASNQLKRLTADDGSGVLGMALGGGLAGLVASGEADPAWAAGGAIFGGLAKPGAVIRRMAAVETLARQVDGKVAGSLRRIARQATPVAVKAAAPAVRAAARAEDRQQRIQGERRQMAIETMTAQPQALQSELASLYAGISGSAPNTAKLAAGTSQRALDYLLGQLPPQPERYGVLDSPAERLSPSEAVTFNRKAAAVEEPWSLLGHVADGELTTDQVEAVAAVYPGLLEDIRAQALDEVMSLQEADKTLPYETAGQLSTLTGVPMVAANSPQMGAAAQAAFAAQAAQPAPQMTRRPREKVADYASEMRTPREQLGQVEA